MMQIQWGREKTKWTPAKVLRSDSGRHSTIVSELKKIIEFFT